MQLQTSQVNIESRIQTIEEAQNDLKKANG